LIEESAIRSIGEDALISGLDDWVGLWELVHAAERLLTPVGEDKIREAVLSAIERLLADELVQVGDLSAGRVFKPWVLSNDLALARIDAEWLRLERLPDIGDVCWLNNTEAGNAKARGLPSLTNEMTN
jgi:hypothetical protein